MADLKHSIRLRNSKDSVLEVRLEPFGELHLVEAGKVICIDIAGPAGIPPDDMLEIEAGKDYVTVWGWPQSNSVISHAMTPLPCLP